MPSKVEATSYQLLIHQYQKLGISVMILEYHRRNKFSQIMETVELFFISSFVHLRFFHEAIKKFVTYFVSIKELVWVIRLTSHSFNI